MKAESGNRTILITGGAGFIGTNLAYKYLKQGNRVRILDNLSRRGVEENVRKLLQRYKGAASFALADIRDEAAVREAVRGADQVFHFAAQVAVTTSVQDPVADCDVNVRGTLNVLEAVRNMKKPPPVLYTSTNKIYGDMSELPLERGRSRYLPLSREVREFGVSETARLDFHSPYGCSKGAADQYVLDYARIYNLPTVVFRMSCMYGPYQFGTEDQGWVAHFLIRALEKRPITIYGDGLQVRDIMFVEDLVRAMQAAMDHIDSTAGNAYNVGGGSGNTVSLLELLDLIGEINGGVPELLFREWRQGDQRYYVSDIRELNKATGWRPEIGMRQGVRRLYQWLRKVRVEPAQVRESLIH
jgi:CDP-paratose 2-epimerase